MVLGEKGLVNNEVWKKKVLVNEVWEKERDWQLKMLGNSFPLGSMEKDCAQRFQF